MLLNLARGGINKVSKLLNPDNWYLFKDSKGFGQYAIGGPTVEMWYNSWKEYHSDNSYYIIYLSKGTYGCNVGLMNPSHSKQEFPEEPLWFPNNEDKFQDDMLNLYGYWMAAPDPYESSDCLYVLTANGKGSIGTTSGLWGTCGLRPVVCLYEGVSATWDATNNVYRLSK